MIRIHTKLFVSGLLCCICLTSLFAISIKPPGNEWYEFSSEALLTSREFSHELSEQEIEIADNLIVQLATLGKGDPLYVWFGHTALVITDLRSNRKIMYDYGIFSFSSGFYKSFIMGRMLYEVWATSAEGRYEEAMQEDRDIRIMTLNLEPSVKLELVRFLNFNIQTEYQQYLYHHYDENCSTRIRDIIDTAVLGQFKAWAMNIPSDYTIRQDVMRHTMASPLIDWLLNFLQNSSIDRKVSLWERMFLPQVLEKALLDFSYIDSEGNTVPMVSSSEVMYVQSDPSIRPEVLESWQSPTAMWFIGALVISSLIGLLSFAGNRTYTKNVKRMYRIIHGVLNASLALVFGMCGTVLLFMMLFTTHNVTYWNENILIVHPLLLLCAIQSIRGAFGREKAMSAFRRNMSVMTVLVLLLISVKLLLPEVFLQNNWQIILTVFPFYLVNSSLLHRLFDREKRMVKQDRQPHAYDTADLGDI